jgi:hypothetical protein
MISPTPGRRRISEATLVKPLLGAAGCIDKWVPKVKNSQPVQMGMRWISATAVALVMMVELHEGACKW